MRNIIKSILMTMLIMLSLNGVAQKVNPKLQEKFDAQLTEMTEVMELDESQQAKVKELITKVHFERQKVRKQHEKGTEEFKNGNKAITKNYHQALRGFCSNEQMKALFANYKKKKANKTK